jgi:hypothetical protein|tara:strand:+ start:243 stop:647 length:405 start_codon:yes stop_codon:yes gene_type:complete
MRKLTFLAILCFITTIASAQLHISTNLKMNFSWDEINDDWKFESQDEESLTFIEFNKELTMVKHTTPTMTSAYIIKSSEHDEEEGRDQYIYMIVSDVGNKYMMILDFINDNIRFISNDLSYMVKHRIKASWTDD